MGGASTTIWITVWNRNVKDFLSLKVQFLKRRKSQEVDLKIKGAASLLPLATYLNGSFSCGANWLYKLNEVCLRTLLDTELGLNTASESDELKFENGGIQYGGDLPPGMRRHFFFNTYNYDCKMVVFIYLCKEYSWFHLNKVYEPIV